MTIQPWISKYNKIENDMVAGHDNYGCMSIEKIAT
jgi:hypothetical protein